MNMKPYRKRLTAAKRRARRIATDMTPGDVRYVPPTFLIDGFHMMSGLWLIDAGLEHVEPLNHWRKPEGSGA